MAELRAPEDLPIHVPGKVLVTSDGLGWNGVSLRSYAYQGQDVEVTHIYLTLPFVCDIADGWGAIGNSTQAFTRLS